MRAQTEAPAAVRVLGQVGGDGTSVPAYAIALGAFRRAQLDVSMSGSGGGGASIAAVVGGSAELCFTNLISAVAAIERGIPIRILAPAGMFSSKAPDILLMKARGSPLRSGADLGGKVVVVPTLSGELELGASLWIAHTGGDPKSVKFVEGKSSAMAALLKQGRADAAMMTEPFMAAARADVEELGDGLGQIAPFFIDSVFVTSTAWLGAHPDAARRLVRVLVQTARWANGHHAETAAMLVRNSGDDPATVAVMTRATYATALAPALLQPPLDAAFGYGLLPRAYDARDIVAAVQPYW